MLLKLDKIGYRYKDAGKDEYVFTNISYNFEKGKIYAIKGPSGSGKTTLLSLISGLEKCSLGHIYYQDNDLSTYDLDHYRNTDIGIIFQSYNLIPYYNALENVILSMDINGDVIKDKEKYAKELLEKVGLNENQLNRRVLKLSGGEQQRVAIARSLSYNPDIILADEPTGNLDKQTENSIMKIFRHLASDEDKCVIIVTHSDNVSKLSDEVLEIKKLSAIV
jgi:putative ABC transport system ATP-binding protein